MSNYLNTPQEQWFRRFIARGYKESGKMITDNQRRQIDLHLDDIESAKRGLAALAERLEFDGYALAGSLVRDGMDYLNDITWLDFTADIDITDEEPPVQNVNVVNT